MGRQQFSAQWRVLVYPQCFTSSVMYAHPALAQATHHEHSQVPALPRFEPP